MSMKSFDKFCEHIILGEPGSEKEIFDERQKYLRTQITLRVLTIYAGFSALLVLANDMMGFLESCFAGLVFAASVMYVVWVIYAAAKECLFGVQGKQTITTALTVIAEVPVFSFLLLSGKDEKTFMVVEQGRLTDRFVIIVSLVLFAISALTVIIADQVKKHHRTD